MIVFISGLPGAGKSTVGAALAEKLSWQFCEADDFLTDDMKAQISRGELLTPEQLDTWVLEGVIPGLVHAEQNGPVVAAGILAEPDFRERLITSAEAVIFYNLDVPYDVLVERISERDHIAKREMLDKCWPERARFVLNGHTINATQSVENIVEEIRKHIYEQGTT